MCFWVKLIVIVRECKCSHDMNIIDCQDVERSSVYIPRLKVDGSATLVMTDLYVPLLQPNPFIQSNCNSQTTWHFPANQFSVLITGSRSFYQQVSSLVLSFVVLNNFCEVEQTSIVPRHIYQRLKVHQYIIRVLYLSHLITWYVADHVTFTQSPRDPCFILWTPR